MQGLDNLTKGELLDLVRTLEHRLEHVEPDAASVTIDARPRLELAVSQALMQQRLASIVETSHDAILSWSLDGTLISWNDGAEALLGYSAEETLGKSLVMLMPPGDSTWEELTRAAAAGEKILHQATVRRHRTGALIQVAVTCSPMRDETGRAVAVSCIARDIRQQKLQERLVAEGHRRLKQAVESADLSLWDWDVAGSRVHYDDAFARLLGYDPGELPSDARPWDHLIHPDDAVRVAGRLDEADHAGDRGRRVVLQTEREREVEHQLRVGRALDLRVERRVDGEREVSLGVVEAVEEAVVHEQPAAVPERVAVRLLDRRPRGGADVREDEPRAELARELAQVAVVPGRLDAVEDAGCVGLVVPAHAEAIAVCCFGAHRRVQALVHQGVSRRIERFFEEDRRS